MKRAQLNPGDPDRALPYGASCAASCKLITECRASNGIKGHEGECVHTPSRFIKNEGFFGQVTPDFEEVEA